MATRTLAKFVPTSRRLTLSPSWTRWAGYAAMALSAVLTLLILWVGPRAWGASKHRQLMEAFNDAVTAEPIQIGNALEAKPTPGPGFPESPEAARGLLEAHPLVIAAIQRGSSRVFVREGWKLPEYSGTERGARYHQWSQEIERSPEDRFDPPLPPEEPPTFLLKGPQWIWVLQWRPGSEEAESFLRRALGAHPKVRAGLARIDEVASRTPKASLAGVFLPPNLQTSMDGPEAEWTVVWTGTILGIHWETIFQPWPEKARDWQAQVQGRVWLARVAGLCPLALLGLGVTFRRRHRRQEALEADRLAALAHSLKTPLAIHKLRCDTLRMGHLEPTKAGEELMRLGDEVDDLTRLIERGLMARHGAPGALETEPFGPEWLEDVAESFRPAVEAQQRHLELTLTPHLGQAHLPSLQSALQTILENAYYHGAGTIRLCTRPGQGHLRLEVSDEGSGVDGSSLEALARPFQRVRMQGEEGFRHEGQGLGLSLLLQVARQEGWGLELWSEPQQGFSVRIDLPLASVQLA